jgi:hypothetical protein
MIRAMQAIARKTKRMCRNFLRAAVEPMGYRLSCIPLHSGYACRASGTSLFRYGYALLSIISLSAISAINSPLVGLSLLV